MLHEWQEDEDEPQIVQEEKRINASKRRKDIKDRLREAAQQRLRLHHQDLDWGDGTSTLKLLGSSFAYDSEAYKIEWMKKSELKAVLCSSSPEGLEVIPAPAIESEAPGRGGKLLWLIRGRAVCSQSVCHSNIQTNKQNKTTKNCLEWVPMCLSLSRCEFSEILGFLGQNPDALRCVGRLLWNCCGLVGERLKVLLLGSYRRLHADKFHF